MKPCLHRRKAIALLALEELEGREAEELRLHLQSCDGCRCYLEEISTLTKRMAAVEMAPDIEASEAFHREVMSRLRARERVGIWEIVRMVGRRVEWRVASPVMAVLILFIAYCSQLHESGMAPKPIVPGTTQLVAAPDADPDVAPTLGNYQMAADQSLQKFDAFLNREARSVVSGAPVYTVAELTMANGM